MIPAKGQGCPGKTQGQSFRKFAGEICRDRRLLTLSPAGRGGEGRVREAGEPVRRTAHLTLPPLSAHACVRLSDGASPMRQGPLPLRSEERRGILANRMTDDPARNREPVASVGWHRHSMPEVRPSRNALMAECPPNARRGRRPFQGVFRPTLCC